MRKISLLLTTLLFLFCMNANAEQVFSGEHEVGSWNAQQLPVADYPVLAKANAGDVIAITVTAVESGARVTLQDISWSGFADEYNCEAGVHYFVLTEASAAKLNEGGLIVTGEKYTFNKVELLYRKTLWEGTVDDNSGWGQSDALGNDLFAELTAGSLLGVDVTAINDGASWHQMAIRVDYSDNMITGSTSEAKTLLYELTDEQVTTLQKKTINVIAQYLKVSAIYTYIEEKTADSPVVWEGETVFSSTWSVYETIPASCFSNAQEGYLLRVKFKDLKAGACLQLSDNSWTLLAGTDNAPSISGVYHQYTITSEMLAKLQDGGMIVSGTSFTLIAIEILDPASLKTLTLSVPVTSNWVYTNAPSFTIHVENPYDEAVVANAAISITTDKLAAVTTIYNNVEIAANSSEDIVLTMDDTPAAGFYHATATVNDDLARSFFFAVNPTSITSAPDKQDDFDTFWSTAKNQLDAIDINATLTEIPSKSTAARKVYLVEMQSVPDGLTGDPVTIRGYYCEPTDKQKHPVVMHYQGYDSGYRPGGEATTPYCPSGDANPNLAEFILSTRGQSVNNRLGSEREDGLGDFANTYGDWFAFNFGNKDAYYYRGAYMDVVRAIDFMASRETSDMENLYAEGQSQGGAFTYAAAALSGYTFNAIAPAITFMGDFPDYFDITSWPASVARENQGSMTDEEMFAFLSYFDTKNLATMVSCPVITSIGLQDNVCPPHTNIAPYNNVQTAEADKQMVYNPELQHQVNGDWYTTYMAFFDNYAVNREDAETVWEGSQATGNWENYVNLSYDNRGELANARMTDIIRVTLTTTDEDAQVQLSNPANGWAAFSDAAFSNLNYSIEPQTFSYAIASASVLEDIQQTGIIVAGKNITISRVELVKTAGRYNAASVTIGAEGIISYSSSKSLDFSGTGLTPYYASEATTGTVTMTSVATTWGYQGYLIKGAAGTYDVPVTENAEYPSPNYLKATSDYSATVDASTDGAYHYIFAKKNDNSEYGFYKLTSNTTLAAHKAYLETSTDIVPVGGTRLSISFDGVVTGIYEIANGEISDEPNSRTVPMTHSPLYDLQGRRVSSPQKGGIYIKNNRKYIIK
jgi:cephalosporin-C deacetylase